MLGRIKKDKERESRKTRRTDGMLCVLVRKMLYTARSRGSNTFVGRVKAPPVSDLRRCRLGMDAHALKECDHPGKCGCTRTDAGVLDEIPQSIRASPQYLSTRTKTNIRVYDRPLQIHVFDDAPVASESCDGSRDTQAPLTRVRASIRQRVRQDATRFYPRALSYPSSSKSAPS